MNQLFGLEWWQFCLYIMMGGFSWVVGILLATRLFSKWKWK